MIYDCEGDWTKSCILSDFSNGGAKITAVSVSAVPDYFMLRIARGVKPRKCHVVWRSADALGLEFIDRGTVTQEPNKRRRAATPV